jgi:hydroxymethylpyrimidine/phosphomethylpyrimidine kinase
MPRLLVIAGSDSSAGAGLQADLKTALAFGVYAQTAVTAITVQNTLGVTGAYPVPPDTVRAQIIACLSDIGADAIKTGMLGDAAMVRTVAATLAEHGAAIPLVLDPVMVAKGGARLLAREAVDAVRALLLPRAALVTPNLPECEALIGFAPAGAEEAPAAAGKFHALGARHVLFKGGHGQGKVVRDILADGETGEVLVLQAPRIDTPHTHGTGCTLATAIACGLAEGLALAPAVRRAHAYVQRAIATAPGLGGGHGPLNHRPPHSGPDDQR